MAHAVAGGMQYTLTFSMVCLENNVVTHKGFVDVCVFVLRLVIPLPNIKTKKGILCR